MHSDAQIIEDRGRLNSSLAGPAAVRSGIPAFALLLVVAALIMPASARAHHSGAVFYEKGGEITITGTVQEFRFHNPHAIIIVTRTNDDGEAERWTVETSSPSALRRRGWSSDSLHAGETVTLDGVRAKDGSLLMRVLTVTKSDGTVVGERRGTD